MKYFKKQNSSFRKINGLRHKKPDKKSMTLSKSDTILIQLGHKEYQDLGLVKLTLITKKRKDKKILLIEFS